MVNKEFIIPQVQKTEKSQIKNIWGKKQKLELIQNRARRQSTLVEFHYYLNCKISMKLEKGNNEMNGFPGKK